MLTIVLWVGVRSSYQSCGQQEQWQVQDERAEEQVVLIALEAADEKNVPERTSCFGSSHVAMAAKREKADTERWEGVQ